MEISWTDRVKQGAVLQRMEEEPNILVRLTGLVTSCIKTAF